MSKTLVESLHLRFDNFEFDNDMGLVHENGEKIKLKPKELAVLELLLRQHGKLVSKEQIVKSVWKGGYASDESIARCISVIKAQLRAASPGADALIQSEYGRGYRFMGVVFFGKPNQARTHEKPKLIADIASRDILYCLPETTVFKAAELLNQQQKSSIIVRQNNVVVGIWTEADAMTLDFSAPNLFELEISQLMRMPVLTIQEWKPISEAVQTMRTHGIRHLLVVDKLGQPFGIVSQTDLVQAHGVESFLTVKDVKSVECSNPLVIRQNMQIAELVQRMSLSFTEIAIINLTEDKFFAFTERDLMGLIAKQQLQLCVADLKQKPLISVNENMTLLAARQLMEIEHIRHLAVVDFKGDLIKLLSMADILTVIEFSYLNLYKEIFENNKKTISAKNAHIQMLTNAVQQTAGMILITNKFGEIEYVNQAFERITGYTFEEVKGLNPRFLKSNFTTHATYQNLWQTLAGGKTWKGELCNQTKAGSNYWVLASITPIYNETNELLHFVAVEEDITERVQREAQLKEFKQRFHETANTSPILFWEAGVDGKIHYLNQFWFEFTGRELDELYGNGWAKQLHPEDLNGFLDTFQQSLVARSAFTLEHRLKNSAGEYRWVINNAKPRSNETGDFYGFIGYCIDITELKIRELAINCVQHPYSN